MCSKDCYKECWPELHKLLQLYSLIALSSATAEPTFSAMRRIKSCTRSIMTGNSLSNKIFTKPGFHKVATCRYLSLTVATCRYLSLPVVSCRRVVMETYLSLLQRHLATTKDS